jgi:hypothetical protein
MFFNWFGGEGRGRSNGGAGVDNNNNDNDNNEDDDHDADNDNDNDDDHEEIVPPAGQRRRFFPPAAPLPEQQQHRQQERGEGRHRRHAGAGNGQQEQHQPVVAVAAAAVPVQANNANVNVNVNNGEPLRLISEEEWFRLYTLRDADSVERQRYEDGTPNHNDDVQRRVDDERSYVNRVIQDAFRQDDEQILLHSRQRSSSFGSSASAGSYSSSCSSWSMTSDSSAEVAAADRRRKLLRKWKQSRYQLQIECMDDRDSVAAVVVVEEDYSATAESSVGEVSPPSSPPRQPPLPPLRFPLDEVAARSDTIFTMASSMARFLMKKKDHHDPHHHHHCHSSSMGTTITTTTASSSASSNNSDVGDATATDDPGDHQKQNKQQGTVDQVCGLEQKQSPTYDQEQEHQEQDEQPRCTILVLPLHDYPRRNVDVFFRLLLGQIDPVDIPDDAVVDCCRLAHYLQCDRNRTASSSGSSSLSNKKIDGQNDTNRNNVVALWRQETPRMTLVEEIADVCLNPSVDSSNCMSLCQLAEQFELETLREISLNHIVTSLSSLEGHEFWEELPLTMRTEIEKMRTIMVTQQHLHGGTLAKKKLFFNSCREYIALLEEQYDYHVERLQDANVEQQQKALEIGTCYRTHSSWLYAQCKIERHASKVRVLKHFLDEQRRIFGSNTPEE